MPLTIMKIIDFQRGLSFQTDSKNSKFYNQLKKILNFSGVFFVDPCCPGASTSNPPAIFFTTAQDDIAAGTGGAISVTNYLTTVNTDAGGDAFTLADGTVYGQMKKILFVTDGGGDAVITPATELVSGDTTITLDDSTDFVVLIWDGTAWSVIENSGATLS